MTSNKIKTVRRFRVRDSRGIILIDIAHDYEAKAAAKAWNGRPIGAAYPARIIPLSVTVREVRR